MLFCTILFRWYKSFFRIEYFVLYAYWKKTASNTIYKYNTSIYHTKDTPLDPLKCSGLGMEQGEHILY